MPPALRPPVIDQHDEAADERAGDADEDRHADAHRVGPGKRQARERADDEARDGKDDQVDEQAHAGTVAPRAPRRRSDYAADARGTTPRPPRDEERRCDTWACTRGSDWRRRSPAARSALAPAAASRGRRLRPAARVVAARRQRLHLQAHGARTRRPSSSSTAPSRARPTTGRPPRPSSRPPATASSRSSTATAAPATSPPRPASSSASSTRCSVRPARARSRWSATRRAG